jgi:hypothetical protein
MKLKNKVIRKGYYEYIRDIINNVPNCATCGNFIQNKNIHRTVNIGKCGENGGWIQSPGGWKEIRAGAKGYFDTCYKKGGLVVEMRRALIKKEFYGKQF